MVIFANFCRIGLPPMGMFFELQQHTIPQKTAFIMKIYDFENQEIV